MAEEKFNLFSSRFFIPILIFSVIFLAAATAGQIIDSMNKYREGHYIGQGNQYKNTISISGVGKILAKPDIGQVNLTVLSRAATVNPAVKENTEKMNKIVQGMKDLGIAENDLKTVNYSISPEYQYTNGKSVIIGYTVSQALEVKIRDLDKVGTILEKATSSGANQVGSLSFTFDDPEKLKSDARQKAIDDAKSKAGVLAKSLGVSLGKITNFSESGGDNSSNLKYYSLEAGVGGGGTPDIQTGQNELEVRVSITYEIY